MRQFQGGDIWMAIRDGLVGHRERLIQAFDAGSFEREAAILDDIARKVTEKVEPMVHTYNDKS